MVRFRRGLGCFASLLAVVTVAGACGGGGEPPTQGPPSSTRPAPEGSTATDAAVRLTEYPVPSGSHPHDVAPASDGMVWYTAQATGRLGRLDPATGRTEELPLGEGRRRTG